MCNGHKGMTLKESSLCSHLVHNKRGIQPYNDTENHDAHYYFENIENGCVERHIAPRGNINTPLTILLLFWFRPGIQTGQMA